MQNPLTACLFPCLLFTVIGAALAEDAIPMHQSITTKALLTAVTQRFQEVKPGPAFDSTIGLSSVGVKAVGEGEARFAAIVRDLSPTDRKSWPELKAAPFCVDVMVLTVHADNPVADLTREQVGGLFTGAIATWKAVGGADAAPVLVARIPTFATLDFFEASFGIKRVLDGAVMRFKEGGPVAATPSNNEKALAAVAGDPAAVTFASLAMVNELKAKGVPLKILAIGGVEPNQTNVQSGKYAAKRQFYIITKGDPQGRVQDFVGFLLGAEGQKIVAAKGFIPLAP